MSRSLNSQLLKIFRVYIEVLDIESSIHNDSVCESVRWRFTKMRTQ